VALTITKKSNGASKHHKFLCTDVATKLGDEFLDQNQQDYIGRYWPVNYIIVQVNYLEVTL
jgi:hypothetical protein